jgi:mono/diheme cytochrome c family protein
MSYKLHATAAALLVTVAGLAAQAAHAESPNEVLQGFHQEASATPGFQGFSARRGEALFNTRHGNDWSCSSCHTENPAAAGKHAKTGKAIEPLAPVANAERFTNPKKVEKWFKRNCNDVMNRACTAQEKGDVLTYLLTVKK